MSSRKPHLEDDGDGYSDDDYPPLSRRMYQRPSFVTGGACLSPRLQHALAGLLDEAYAGLTGGRARLSASEADERRFAEAGVAAEAITYGELSLPGVLEMLWSVRARPGERFYDVGSGAGRATMVAWMLGLRSTGIELARSRYDAACEACAALEARWGRCAAAGLALQRQAIASTPSFASRTAGLPQRICSGLDFWCCNAVGLDMSDADVLFISSVAFPESLMVDLAASILPQLRPGVRIISFKPLVGPRLAHVGTFEA